MNGYKRVAFAANRREEDIVPAYKCFSCPLGYCTPAHNGLQLEKSAAITK